MSQTQSPLTKPQSRPREILRGRLAPPDHPAGSTGVSVDFDHQIIIRHPGYPQPNNILLILQAPDPPDGGLVYDTAHTICGIIAGNRWNGFFSRATDGSRVDLGRDDVLPVGDYYFHLPGAGSENKYPVNPRFSDWSFPHGDLPPSWAQQQIDVSDFAEPPRSAGTSTVIHRDGSCRLTNYQEGTEMAHICPRSEVDWFKLNNMKRYVGNQMHPHGIDDAANVLLLRADIHRSFDQRRIIFVPKSGKWVAHILGPFAELIRLYHNVELQPLNGVRKAYLLARLAWSIFPLLSMFLEYDKRLLCVRVDGVLKVSNYSEEDLKKLTGAQGTKSRGGEGQKKRGRSNEQGDVIGEAAEGSTSSTPSSEWDNIRVAPTADMSDDERRWQHLRATSLQKERARSDPEGTWVKELAWAKKAFRSTLGGNDALRVYAAMGADVRFEEDEP